MTKHNHTIIRMLDFCLATAGFIAFSPAMVTIFVACFFDTGRPIFTQIRNGRFNEPFQIIKFRTMKTSSLEKPTHLVDKNDVTKLGKFLRKTKLDELPQLINVIIGNMSLVGPRPCLMTQTEIIAKRKALGVHLLTPGITGLAQIHGVDMASEEELIELDCQLCQTIGPRTYLTIIYQTAMLVLRSKPMPVHPTGR